MSLTLGPSRDGRHRMLALLTLCASLVMVLVVTEQGQTIETQGALIQLLGADSAQWQSERARQVKERNAKRNAAKENQQPAPEAEPLEQYRVDPDPLPPPSQKKPTATGVRVLLWT